MSEIGLDYLLTLALWFVVLAVFLFSAWKTVTPVAGLSIAYWIQLAMNHLVGGAIQLLPWHDSPYRSSTLLGFPLTGYAMAGLLVGHVLVRRWMLHSAPARQVARPAVISGPELGWICIFTGAFLFFLLSGLLRFIPSLGSILSNGLNLTVAGFCLVWWTQYQSGRKALSWGVAAGILVLPVMTVLLQGFLGFGVTAVLTFAAFAAVSGISRRTVLIGGPVLAFACLSLWSVYAGVRDDIRDAVWGGVAMEDRMSVTSSSLRKNWSWFDIGSAEHLEAIEGRLNQNSLVGAARREIEAGRVERANGETMWNAVVALVPRAVWPEKPSFAGSGSLVTRFTGIQFGAGTSVGIGHVMEFYVNFGEAGVFLGFVALGALLAALDLLAGKYLRAGYQEGFLLCYVPGLTFLLAGGTLAETPPAAVGSILLCLVMTRYVFPYAGRQFRTVRPAGRNTKGRSGEPARH